MRQEASWRPWKPMLGAGCWVLLARQTYRGHLRLDCLQRPGSQHLANQGCRMPRWPRFPGRKRRRVEFKPQGQQSSQSGGRRGRGGRASGWPLRGTAWGGMHAFPSPTAHMRKHPGKARAPYRRQVPPEVETHAHAAQQEAACRDGQCRRTDTEGRVKQAPTRPESGSPWRSCSPEGVPISLCSWH